MVSSCEDFSSPITDSAPVYCINEDGVLPWSYGLLAIWIAERGITKVCFFFWAELLRFEEAGNGGGGLLILVTCALTLLLRNLKLLMLLLSNIELVTCWISFNVSCISAAAPLFLKDWAFLLGLTSWSRIWRDDIIWGLAGYYLTDYSNCSDSESEDPCDKNSSSRILLELSSTSGFDIKIPLFSLPIVPPTEYFLFATICLKSSSVERPLLSWLFCNWLFYSYYYCCYSLYRKSGVAGLSLISCNISGYSSSWSSILNGSS